MSQKNFVQVGSAHVAYFVTGAGPGIILVHGAGASKDTNWGALTEQLKDDYTVVALDLSGSGETTDDGGQIELQHLADQVTGVAKAANLDSFHLVGYSMGSVVAAMVAAQRPELVRSLTLAATWAKNNTRIQHEFDLWARLFKQDKESWVRFAVLLGTGPEIFSQLDETATENLVQGFLQITPDGVPRQADLIGRANVSALLPQIKAPTLVIGLTQDQMILVENAREVRDLIPGARYVELDSGHLAPFQHPEQFARFIVDFLENQKQK